MKGMIAAAYFFALGYYVKATRLDEDLIQIARDNYKLAVLETMKIVRDQRRKEVAGDPKGSLAA